VGEQFEPQTLESFGPTTQKLYRESPTSILTRSESKNIKKIWTLGELPAAAQKNLCSKQQGAEENQLWNRELARSRPKPGLDTRTSSTGKSGRESGTQTRGHRSKSDAQTNLRERMKNVQRTAEHTKQIGDSSRST
jgi:hypothetical protein